MHGPLSESLRSSLCLTSLPEPTIEQCLRAMNKVFLEASDVELTHALHSSFPGVLTENVPAEHAAKFDNSSVKGLVIDKWLDRVSFDQIPGICSRI